MSHNRCRFRRKKPNLRQKESFTTPALIYDDVIAPNNSKISLLRISVLIFGKRVWKWNRFCLFFFEQKRVSLLTFFLTRIRVPFEFAAPKRELASHRSPETDNASLITKPELLQIFIFYILKILQILKS